MSIWMERNEARSQTTSRSGVAGRSCRGLHGSEANFRVLQFVVVPGRGGRSRHPSCIHLNYEFLFSRDDPSFVSRSTIVDCLLVV